MLSILALGLPDVTVPSVRAGDETADPLHGGSGVGVRVIGQTDLGGAGLNGHVAVLDDHAYVGFGTNGGQGGTIEDSGVGAQWAKTPDCPTTPQADHDLVKIVSLSNPAHPEVVATIEEPTSNAVSIVARDVATLRVSSPFFSGDLLAVAFEACRGGFVGDEREAENYAHLSALRPEPVGVNFYDVTNPRLPILLGRDDRRATSLATRSISLVQRPDGRILAIEANQSGPAGGIHVVDVTNPRSPLPVGTFDTPNEGRCAPTLFFGECTGIDRDYSTQECRPFNFAQGASFNTDGTKAYVAYQDQGLFVLDLSDLRATVTEPLPNLPVVSHTRYAANEEGNSFRFVPNGSETVGLVTDEDLLPARTTVTVTSGLEGAPPEREGATAGVYRGCEAIWGAPLYRQPDRAIRNVRVRYVGDACSADSLPPASVVQGTIALAERSVCRTDTMARAAQEKGAVAVLVRARLRGGDENAGPLFSPDSAEPVDAGVTIPVVMVSHAFRNDVCCFGSAPVIATLEDAPDGWGALRIFDLTSTDCPAIPSPEKSDIVTELVDRLDPDALPPPPASAPSFATTGPCRRQASVFHSPHSNSLPPPECLDCLYHAVNPMWVGDQALVAWMSDGLRVVDASDPYNPKARAWFVPPAAEDPTGNYPGVPLVVDVERWGDKVVISDINGGLYVLDVVLRRGQCLQGGHVRYAFGSEAACVALFNDGPHDPELGLGSWRPTPPGATPRYGHSATMLPDGTVFVAGGADPDGRPLASAERYDPRTNIWLPTDPLPAPGRMGHTATPLPDGRVLLAGGCETTGLERCVSSTLLFDPGDGSGGSWSPGPKMNVPRVGHTATPLGGGAVLVVGGASTEASRSAEVLDASRQVWVPTAPPSGNRYAHTATLLSGSADVCGQHCGRVLVAGGSEGGLSSGVTPPDRALPSSDDLLAPAELYDPATRRFLRAPVRFDRSETTATPLGTGAVLFAGGRHGITGMPTASAERFEPTSSEPGDAGQPVGHSMHQARFGHAASPLRDGGALVIGGRRVGPLASAEIYDPAVDEWYRAARLHRARASLAGRPWLGPTATLISSDPTGVGDDAAVCATSCGTVLVVGGSDEAVAEIYQPRPTADTVEPAEGPAAGGTEVTISGTGFGAGTRVLFGGVASPEVTVVKSTRLVARTPPARPDATPAAEVTVITSSGFASAPKFTYTAVAAVDDLSATPNSARALTLRFSAPSEPGAVVVPAGGFLVKQSTAPIPDDAAFDAAPALCDGVCTPSPAPGHVGASVAVSVAGLSPDTTYHYALRGRGPSGELGPLSNVAVATMATVAPGSVREVEAQAVAPDQVRLSFSAAGADGEDGPPASDYLLRLARDGIGGEEAFGRARPLCGGVCRFGPAEVGQRLTLTVNELAPATTYHFAVRSRDSAGNLGPISSASVTTPPRGSSAASGAKCVIRTPGPGQVALGAGHSLVGMPDGTRVPARGSLYSWFDLGRGGTYTAHDPAEPLAGGRGYWAWSPCPNIVDLAGVGTAKVTLSLGAYRGSMVGNPSGDRSATVMGQDFVARWDPTLSGGSGGYHLSGYRQPAELAVGEGAWVFSYDDATVVVSTG